MQKLYLGEEGGKNILVGGMSTCKGPAEGGRYREYTELERPGMLEQ